MSIAWRPAVPEGPVRSALRCSSRRWRVPRGWPPVRSRDEATEARSSRPRLSPRRCPVQWPRSRRSGSLAEERLFRARSDGLPPPAWRSCSSCSWLQFRPPVSAASEAPPASRILRTVALELRPTASLSLADRVTLFNTAYEGYVVPFHLEEPQLVSMETSFDVDTDASLVAFRDGEPVGLANLAIRGDEGWIAGVGVVSGARRQGIGEKLMRAVHDEARARGLTRVWLEVIDENTGAFTLYEKL